MNTLRLDPTDLEPGDKAFAALERFRLEIVGEPRGALFDEAFGALEGEFGARGEFERRSVIGQWVSESPRAIGASVGAREATGKDVVRAFPWRYSLLVARDHDGRLAGVRDCHVTLDPLHNIVVVYLAHALILPPFRRSGLGASFRAAPIALARREIHSRNMVNPHVLLAAEMDPADHAVPASLVRLIAYGHSGFAVVAPEYLPYCQPDFRDPQEIGDAPRCLPFLAVVKHLGHEAEGDLPFDLAEAFVRHLYSVFATHCLPEHLDAPRDHALRTLSASRLARVPLYPLPSDVGDEKAVASISIDAVMPFQMPEIRKAAHPSEKR